ncbi:hypothetical protein [Lentibacillus sp. Marseille-P4043]|uniref:hypothetical protein n=1 Tax=Lentibacillus sp. Marseille-P4043 TaxID=2040293 RepID=UPI000D0B1323|nr:hypothetical protein [Lentibacillus sp. Marseille-P4043]
MKLWNIVNDHCDYEIEIDNRTTLSGQHLVWHHLITSIDDFFNNKHSGVKIFEDGQPISKNDWHCFYIPFDAQVQLDKITAKSPLKDIQSAAAEQIAYSPFFQELQDVWKQLEEDLQLLNQQLKQWGIISTLMPFSEKKMTDFISFRPVKTGLSPIEMKKLLLRILLKKPFDKKTLIIVELPEIYASDSELNGFTALMNKAVEKGYKFLFVTQKLHVGSVNYYCKGRIINHALLEQMKYKVINELPFHCSEEIYDQAKEILLDCVDNFNFMDSLKDLSTNDFELLVTIIHVILYNLNIGSNIDIQGLKPNLRKFMMSYR